MKINKKILMPTLIITPVVGVAAGVGIYWGSSKKKTTIDSKQSNTSIEVNTSTNSIYDKVDIFPEIKQYQFYDYIKVEGGKPIIDDEFIAKVINYVVKNMRITDGDVSVNYNQPDIQSLVVTFYWSKQGEKEYWKTYNFSLSV